MKGESAGKRALLTVLFTDIVESTQRAARLGDERWRKVLDAYDAMFRSELKTHRGREVNSTGDGFLAVFETPGQAIRFAQKLIESSRGIDLQVRAGLHTGEVERRGKDIAGIGVHIASRIADLAGPEEIFVSSTIKDLVAGAEFRFVPRGSHALKGVRGKRRLFAIGATTPTTARSKGAPSRKKSRAPTKSAKQISVLLVDDHPLWRQTLRGLLDHSGVARVTAEAGDGQEAIERVAKDRPDIVVMDIDIPKLNGIEATRVISRSHPDVKVLVLSSLKERDEVLSAVRAGASGYLLKTAGATEVKSALTRIHAGELVFPAELTPLVLDELRNPRPDANLGSSRLAVLTPRENDVLALMAEGRSNRAISDALHVTAKTVEAHIASIFAKLGLEEASDQHRRVQAVVAYLQDSEVGPRASP